MRGSYHWLVEMFGWIILAVPLAVFGVVAPVVGKAGIGVSGVNVLSDMLVAILLDVGRIASATESIALQSQSEVTNPAEPQLF